MLALLILIKPHVQVKFVEDAAPPHLDEWDVEIGQQRDPTPEIGRRLFSGETAGRRQRQAVVIHLSPHPLPDDTHGLAVRVPGPGVGLQSWDR